MRAVFFKELREHARWVPLGMLALAFAIYASIPTERASIYAAENLDFSIAFSVGGACGAFAILLGAFQTLWDQRDERFGYAYHRAVSQSDILRGKLAAGACLYVAAVTPPLLFALLYFATRSIAQTPMHPWQLLIGVLTAASCLGLLPATFLVVRRESNWFGTRLLPFLAAAVALALFAAGVSVGGWWQVVLLALCILLFVALEYASRYPGRVRSGVLILCSIAVVFGLQILASELLNSFSQPSGSWTSTQFEFDDGGEVWAVEVKYSHNSADDEYLGGSKLAPGLDWNSLGALPKDFSGTPLQYLGSLYGPHVDRSLRYYRASVNAAGQLHLLHPAGYWLAYDQNSNNDFVGIITKDGLHTGVVPQGSLFPPDTATLQYTACYSHVAELFYGPDGILLYSPESGNAIKLFDKPAKWLSLLGEGKERPYDLVVMSTDGLHRLRLVDAAASEDAPTQTWFHNGNPSPLGTVKSIEIAKLPNLPSEFNGYAHIGESNGRYVVASLNAYATLEPESQNWDLQPLVQPARADGPAWSTILGSLTPPAYLVPFTALAYSTTGGQNWPVQSRQAAVMAVITFLIAMLVALAFVGYLCKQRGLTRSETLAWLGATLLLGIATPLAILAIYPRVFRETCEHCGQQRRVDRIQCTHCGAEPAELTTGGIGLFDSGATTPSKPPELVLNQ